MDKNMYDQKSNKMVMLSNEQRELLEAKLEAKKLAKSLEEHKRRENELLKKGSLTYDDLISVKAEDFKYFTAEDFINIIGSEDITLLK